MAVYRVEEPCCCSRPGRSGESGPASGSGPAGSGESGSGPGSGSGPRSGISCPCCPVRPNDTLFVTLETDCGGVTEATITRVTNDWLGFPDDPNDCPNWTTLVMRCFEGVYQFSPGGNLTNCDDGQAGAVGCSFQEIRCISLSCDPFEAVFECSFSHPFTGCDCCNAGGLVVITVRE